LTCSPLEVILRPMITLTDMFSRLLMLPDSGGCMGNPPTIFRNCVMSLSPALSPFTLVTFQDKLQLQELLRWTRRGVSSPTPVAMSHGWVF